MLEKLLKKYPNAFLAAHKTAAEKPAGCLWIEVEEKELGIPLSDLSKKEATLLSLLFPPAWEQGSVPEQKQQWVRFLFEQDASLPLTSWTSVRFIHFRILTPDYSKEDFEEAVLAIVSAGAIIIWEASDSGILIEEAKDIQNNKEELASMVHMLESDLYMKIRFFLGSPHSLNLKLAYHFKMERACFTTAASRLPDEAVSDHAMVLPYLFSEGVPQTDQQWHKKELLGEAADHPDLLATVKAYIEAGSNASLAAKQLYIHRNSLQYRIDRFIEKSGRDIRRFNQALPVYLMLLAP